MGGINEGWEYLTKFPQLLNEYATFSYPLLGVLLAAGLLILGAHVFKKYTGKNGLPGAVVVLGSLLCFLSASGFFLKSVGERQAQTKRDAFITSHRAPLGEHWLLIFDFPRSAMPDEQSREQSQRRMKNLVGSLSEVLLEDLPPGFRQPRIVHVAIAQSPWEQGVGQNNFDDVIRELNAFEIMWGNVHEQGDRAKLFLGISTRLARNLDAIIPLRDFAFDEDLRREHQFGDGYYRLLGLVTLGISLDTYHRAQQASGEERKKLFLAAMQQFNKTREIVNNRRDDPILKRNLYSANVDAIIQTARAEVGLTP